MSNNFTCIYCGQITEYEGWDGLCDRTCYYGLNNLLYSYESGSVSEPDKRLIEYFTLYPSPTHSFSRNKILTFLKRGGTQKIGTDPKLSNYFTCIYCGQITEYEGWDGLCDRSCYHGLNNLLYFYESGSVSEPDKRLIEYFTLYPSPTHSFSCDKIITFIKRNK